MARATLGEKNTYTENLKRSPASRHTYKAVLSVILVISLLFFGAAPIPALATETLQPRICNTPEELTGYILQLAGNRESRISVSIPVTLFEPKMSGYELLTYVFRQDNGPIRWSFQSVAITKAAHEGYITYNYQLTYRGTQEQDMTARRLAASAVDKWDLKNLSARAKMDKLKKYIPANWRYDKTLESMTAYSTLTGGKGTCLGFVMACQLLLDRMGIPSQTVHGRITETKELHILLLVKLGDWWYTFDPTALAREKPVLTSYLKQSYDKGFAPESEYLTSSFRRAHPMSSADLNLPLG